MVALSNLVHVLRRRRLLGAVVPGLVTVGACTFPDYTFEGSVGTGGILGGVGTTADTSSTGFGGIDSTGSSSSQSGSLDTTGTAVSSVGGSEGGGDGGSSLAGSAGEGADGGSDSGGAGGSGGVGGSEVGGVGGGGAGGNGGDAGSGGSGGSGQCGNDDQCRSGQCDDGWCRPEHCDNGAADVYETDVDCGGPYCRPCGYDQHCLEDSDCGTLDCSGAERCRPTLVISCNCNSMGVCNQNPQASTIVDLRLQNMGTAPIALDSLTFRYFYSSEADGMDDVTCESVNFTNGTCALFDGEVLATEYADLTATDEVAFWFSGGVLSPGQSTGSIRFSIHDDGPYQRGNDYSFQDVPTDATVAECEHIVAMNADDVAIWGILPE